MSMVSAQQLADSYALNARLVKMHAADLSSEESLAQSPYNINCMNWVIGHILVARDRVLKLLGEQPVLSHAERMRYETDSPPVKADGDDVIKLERELTLLDEQQQRIAAGLARITSEELTKEIQVGERKTTVGARLFGLYFHNTYHTGQTDLLRQVAGKNDKIV